MLTRREVLAAFLGVPAALAACRPGDSPRLPEGEIVGASDIVGHRLREGARVEIPSDKWERVGTVIVGGGIAGLSAAWRLLKAGYSDFVLLELERAAGGTSASGTAHGVVPYPWGAHYVPAPTGENRALVSLLEEMGVVEGRDARGEPVVAEQFLCRDPEERVFYRGRWYEGLYMHAGASREDLAQLARFDSEVSAWAAWRDARGRRAFTIPVSSCSDDSEVTSLDRLSMAEWMTARGLTSPRLRWFVDYGCRDDYGLTVEQTSAWAGLFYFASRMREPGEETQPLITWPEGNGRIVSHLYDAARRHVRLGLAAADIAPNEDGGVEVVALGYDGREAAGIRARRVVFAAPQFLAPYLIRPYRERGAPAYAREFEYGAWMVANLFLTDRPRRGLGFPEAWDNVLYESPSLGYVSATHQKGIDRGPAVFTYYFPLTGDDPRAARSRLLEAGWREWADVALSDLARAHPDIRAVTRRLDVMRWGHAMIRPRPGFIWGDARRRAAAPLGPIHFAHTDLSGVALFEEAFDQALRAAEEILRAEGRDAPSVR
ncbi:MAG TPA: FAD-dependent oxidoreductase [Pyrinomonadaceae bacterium]|nr:FAD-dependent oxidoreductase [Pyrinomonadaceae bacterium]